ncbi:retrovirus-related pol polyprotein from transposon TNT 1-94 [Tanacetum coccineum]
MDKEIDLEKKIKELDNIVYKVGQSAQTVHMLTKPQVFYDDTHKQALGYQNPFYLKKAQRIKPTLYDGSVISSQHAVIPVIDDEETLILEEVSRSKMLAKQNDPISKEKKINTTPINYVELNRLSEDFGKRFVPQQELSAEQAFWLQTSHPNTDQSDISPVKIEAPRELPKVSLVNTSLKKLKYHLGKFDTVVKKRITPDAITEGEWGFEHTKAVFLNEIIPFLKTLKDIFNVFDKDLLNEVTEVQTVFNQMEAAVQQCSLQAKDTTIRKLKEHIKTIRENDKEEKVKQDMDEFETINIELEHSVAKLLSENELLHKEIEHLKKIYKDQFDSIKKSRALSKEHSLQNELRRLKGKNVLDDATTITNATTVAPWILKLDLDPLAHRFTSTKVVPLKETTSHSVETQKPELKVYRRRPKQVKSVGLSKKSKIANKSEPNHSWGSNATDVTSSSSLVNDRLSRLFSGTVRFKNDQIAKIMGYGDYQLGNVTISMDPETHLYTISLDDMLKTSSICLLSKASKTKSWLWHRRLSHLNFGTLNKLAKDGLVRGIPKLKFKKDHLCSACALGKSKKSSHQPKAEDTNQEKLYLLHMDLCIQMRVESINGKKYILVIVDDYSRFTWVKFLRSKDEIKDYAESSQ